MLNPDPRIGGLEIASGALRFVLLDDDGSVVTSAFAALPAGTVVDGTIADNAGFRAACVELRRAIGGLRVLPVIVSLPAPAVYSQIFAVPAARAEQLEESARLNLRMISPIAWDSAYADWQKSAGSANADGSLEALGAFAEAHIVDAYHAALRASGFLPVAIEFSSLSLARALAASADMGSPDDPYLVVSLTGDGMTLIVTKNGIPQFTEYAGWESIAEPTAEGRITLPRFQSVLGAAIRRFLNFYRTRFHGVLHKALVVNATSNKETAEWIKKEFSLEVFSLGGYGTLAREWCVASGAGLRGLVPRAEDTFISLARVGTEDEFERNHVRRFVALWRAVALLVLGITVVIYLVFDMLIIRREHSLGAMLSGIGITAGNAEVAALAVQAANFNALTEKALSAGTRAVRYAEFLRALYVAAGTRVMLTRVDLDAVTRTVNIQGTAASEQAVIAFKGILENNPAVADVLLPLSAIISIPAGGSTFTATLTIRQ